ncbi:lipocalin-15 [Electrophorus electricus]|uniref:lipocalin-15 n=1 Tax=Electrophorus electricus TaxID=8005 RepID=UPI000F0A5EE4|nr:lipocalin-15 [Electrophorus electricus]
MILAVAVLCSIVLWTHCLHFTDVQPQQDFDLQQFAGEWYRVGIAYETPAFIKYKDQVMTSKGLLLPNENGGANLTMWTLLGSKGCFPNFYVYEKTDVPGLFTYFSQRHKMMKDITVVETNYTEYGVVLKYKKMDKEYTQVALYGRTPVLRPELIEKFRSFVLSLGFSEESIAVPVIKDPCPFTEPSNATETMT